MYMWLALLQLATVREPCPAGCHCETSADNGCALFVQCHAGNTFPPALPPATDCVQLSSPQLSSSSPAAKAAFFAHTLPAGLRLLDLSFCGLGANGGLPAGAFSRFPQLLTLNLEFNALESLPADVFRGADALRTLWLTGNHWQPDEQGYQRAVRMGNRLATLPPTVFSGLRALRVLLLHHNQLASLPPDLFADSAKKLAVVKLVDNAAEFSASDPAFAPLLDERRRCAPRRPSLGGCVQLDLDDDSGDALEDLWDDSAVALLPEGDLERWMRRAAQKAEL